MHLRYSLLVIAFLSSFSMAFAQISAHSPYTIYGMGELNHNANIPGLSMGGTGIANVDSANLNIMNPAMYALLSEGKPIMSFSGAFKFSRFETTTGKLDANRFSLNNLAISFPIKQNWGITIGLNPYSKVGYKIQETTIFDNNDVRTSYIGSGGVNKVFAGVAYRPWRDSSNQLSFGFNIGYLFGTVTRDRSNEFINGGGYLNSKAQESLKFSDLYFDAGLVYQRRLTSSSFLSIGANYVLSKKVNVERENFVYGFTGSLGNESNIDTISYSLQGDGSILVPHKFGVGISYDLFGNRFYQNDKLDFLLKLNVDYSMQDWTKYNVNFNDVTSSDSLSSTNRISFGAEFTPSINTIYKPKVNYGKTMKYRIGGHYATLPYNVNGQQIKDFGISFGLGFPVPIKFTNASVNLGMSLGQTGTTDNNLVRERYMGVYFGLSLSPSVKWFQKRKYD